VTSDSAKALVLPVALLLAFELWARTTNLQSDSLAPPSEIVIALIGAFADFSILAATRDTLFSAFAGLAIGTVIGLALGIAFGISDTLNRLMEVTVESIRPIPSIALLPIALIVAVTVEIAINPLGLGAGIMLAQQALRPDLMLAYLVWIGVIGYALNTLLIVAQRRLFGRAALSGDSA